MPDALISEQEAAARINAIIEQQVDAQIKEAQYWTKELSKIDPDMSLCWVPENSDDAELTPGRWHIRKRLPRAVDALWPLEGPNGEYRSPGSWMIDEIQRSDMWNNRQRKERREIHQKMKKAKERAKRRESEQKADEMVSSLRAGMRLRSNAGYTERSDLKQPAWLKDEKAKEKPSTSEN